jgi:hypothetical protein
MTNPGTDFQLLKTEFGGRILLFEGQEVNSSRSGEASH